MEIGSRIRDIRKKNSMTQDEFASVFGVTRQTVSHWENSRNYPDMEVLKAISDRFNVSFDELLKEDNDLMKTIDDTRNTAIRRKYISLALLILASVMLIVSVYLFSERQAFNSMKYTSDSLSQLTYTLPEESGGYWLHALDGEEAMTCVMTEDGDYICEKIYTNIFTGARFEAEDLRIEIDNPASFEEAVKGYNICHDTKYEFAEKLKIDNQPGIISIHCEKNGYMSAALIETESGYFAITTDLDISSLEEFTLKTLKYNSMNRPEKYR